MITSMVQSLIISMVNDMLGGQGDSLCNTYLFSDTNPDSLSFETPFTGNIKLIYAGLDETGIPAVIVAGRVGTFTPSTDLLNDPQWNYYEIEAVSLSTMIEATANGRVGYFYLDDVEYSVDMGEYVSPSALSGTQLFLLDSLSAGPGNTKSPVYYIAKEAETAGTLRDIWIRPLLGTIPDTNTGVNSSLSTATTTESDYSPSKRVINVDGTQPLDVLSFVPNEFAWNEATIYFEKNAGGGTFDVTEPVVQTVDITGTTGSIGKVTITNPNGTALTPIRLSNFTSALNVSGVRTRTSDITSDYLDVINFAFSGQTTQTYNECVNISDWYTELGITGACINTGTNDSARGYELATDDYRALMDELVVVGITGSDVLTIRPNDNSRELGDMWENIRDEYNTRFASIVRIYGDLSTFQTNGWMLSGDTTHPNETFNAIQANEEYNLNLVALEDAIDLGIEPNWITEFNNLAYIQFDSTVTISGDFTAQMRVRMDNRQFYLWDNEGDNRNSFRINTDGSMRLEIDNAITDSPAGGVSQSSWHTLDISRTGTNFVVNCDGVEVMNATVSTLDILFTRIGRSAAAYLLRGAVAWFIVDGQHKWIMNQNFEDTTIPDLTGSIDAQMIGILDSDTNPMKLSILPNGNLLDYHYNIDTGVYWGLDNNWPTGV